MVPLVLNLSEPKKKSSKFTTCEVVKNHISPLAIKITEIDVEKWY